VYGVLRELASAAIAKEARRKQFRPTALVSDAYRKLFGNGNPGWENRRHFYGAAANAMRQILADDASKHKRKGEMPLGPHSAAELVFGVSAWGPDEILGLIEAMDALQKMDERSWNIVRLRVYTDLSMAQVAEAAGMSVRQTQREWRAAKVWLYRRLHRKSESAWPDSSGLDQDAPS
jgi:RNA polymerase sigma factor (TIGR02999 family)